MNIGQILISGIFKGAFISFWVIGTIMLVLPILQKMAEIIQKRQRRWNISGEKEQKILVSLRSLPLVKGFTEDIDIAESKLSTETYLALMVLLLFIGSFGSTGAIYLLQQNFATGADRLVSTRPWVISGAIGILFASFPYFYVRFRVQRKRHRIALRMISLVQNLIGHYRPRLTLAELSSKSGSTMHEDVKSEWKRLEASLRIKSPQDALYEFANRLGNDWAEDLADILYIGSKTGVNVTGALQKLVKDMMTAKRNEEKRLAMVTVYRIGTVFMVISAFGIILFNIYADGANYKHYFLEAGGQFLIFLTVVILFLSMLMVLRSGRKQF